MSLLVWLPLNKEGDFKNRGLADATVSNNGATYESNGKIGGCYNFNGSSNYLSLNVSNIFKGTNKWSLCAWVNTISGSNYYPIFNIGTSTKGFTLHGNCNRLEGGDGTNHFDSSLSIEHSHGVWNHISITYDGNKFTIYLNGIFRISKDWVYGLGTDNTTVQIGKFWAGPVFKGILNDIRIYDHCLSPKEVKEISKGLVLHYPLNDPWLEGTTNLGNTSINYSNKNYGESYTLSGWGGDNGTVQFFSCGGYNGGPYKVYHKNVSTDSGSGGVYTKTANDIIIESGKTYTMSIYVKASINCYGDAYSFNINRGSDNYYINLGHGFNITTEWQRFSRTFTASSGMAGNYGEMSIIYDEKSEPFDIYYSCFLIEEKDHATPWTLNSRTPLCYDCSGYGNDGTITGTLTTSTDSSIYDKCILFGSNKLISTTASGNHILTMSIWAKDTGILPADGIMFKDHLGDMALGIQSGILYSGKSGGKGAGSISISNTNYISGTWHHFVMVNRNNTFYVYMDGEQIMNGTSGCWSLGTITNALHIGGRSGSSFWPGSLSDFRVYSTALSPADIKELYNTSGIIDDLGDVMGYLFVENIALENIWKDTQECINNKTFTISAGKGLYHYQLSHCKCTLTDDGYRIYRTPDKNYPADSTVMWGGMVIYNEENWMNLTKGHTYLIEFDIKGLSSNRTHDVYWTNLIGWGGGQTAPNPSNIVKNDPNVNGNFNTSHWQHFSYKWTINDDVYKLCTANYNSNSFVAGNTYLSYRLFKYGFTYESTGSLGTDIYINNLRMFDITTNTPTDIDINSKGLIEAFTFTENGDNAFIDSYKGVNSNQLIEI